MVQGVALIHTLAAVRPRQVHTQLAARPALSVTALVHVWHTTHAHTHTHTHTPTLIAPYTVNMIINKVNARGLLANDKNNDNCTTFIMFIVS